MRCVHQGKREKESAQACRLEYVRTCACMITLYGGIAYDCVSVHAEGSGPGGSDHPSHRPGAACRTAQVNFSSGQAPLSGSPMWFHLDRQGLQLQSADSLSSHRAGAVQGQAPLTGCAAHSMASLVPDCPE